MIFPLWRGKAVGRSSPAGGKCSAERKVPASPAKPVPEQTERMQSSTGEAASRTEPRLHLIQHQQPGLLRLRATVSQSRGGQPKHGLQAPQSHKGVRQSKYISSVCASHQYLGQGRQPGPLRLRAAVGQQHPGQPSHGLQAPAEPQGICPNGNRAVPLQEITLTAQRRHGLKQTVGVLFTLLLVLGFTLCSTHRPTDGFLDGPRSSISAFTCSSPAGLRRQADATASAHPQDIGLPPAQRHAIVRPPAAAQVLIAAAFTYTL